MLEREVKLRERLKSLQIKLDQECHGTNDQRYISDLQDSIQGCKSELKFLNEHPDGIQMVNGA